MLTVDYIFNEFKITDDEYKEIDREFGKLCFKAAWNLKRKNFKNNYTEEIEDIVQDLKWAMSKAYVYAKRQIYIESSMAAVKRHATDPVILEVLGELETLWSNRTRHGANKQKFGKYQENILDNLLEYFVPVDDRPDKKSGFQIDVKFSRYCKAIIWNCSKNIGKGITRERKIRSGLVSISEHSFLAG